MAKRAADKTNGRRKPPTQARSQARVANILKAAGALLGEVGYAELSTNLIAERADIPVGSIYQFFEGKDDIVAALVDQFRERILALVGELDAAAAQRDRRAFIARLVDGIAAIQADTSAFVCVFSAYQAHARFDELARELRRTLTAHLDRIFAERLSAAAAGRPRPHARGVVGHHGCDDRESRSQQARRTRQAARGAEDRAWCVSGRAAGGGGLTPSQGCAT